MALSYRGACFSYERRTRSLRRVRSSMVSDVAVGFCGIQAPLGQSWSVQVLPSTASISAGSKPMPSITVRTCAW